MHTKLDEAAWASPWRSRSVAERAALAFSLACWGLLAPSWWSGLGVLAVVAATSLGAARVPPGIYARSLAAPWTFIGLGAIAIAVGLGRAPAPLAALGPFYVTGESLDSAALVVARAFAVTAAVLLLAATCPMSELLSGLRRLGVPAALVDIAASVYRMIFLLLERASAIRHAQAARLGYVGPRRAFASLGQLLATVFLSAWDRARRLEAGLEGRGGTGELVALKPPPPVSARFIAGIFAANALAAALVVLGWWHR
ncbi:MAG: cobalt ECF transporter T component CbiQ [Propionibacteriaceae bacterium]|nr:cobalt ECF transporter T component CbiQ [Propionibacteriaceae bacterium]